MFEAERDADCRSVTITSDKESRHEPSEENEITVADSDWPEFAVLVRRLDAEKKRLMALCGSS